MTDQEINVAIAENRGWQRWKQTDETGTVVILRSPDEKREAYWKSCGCEITDEPLTFDKEHIRTTIPKDLPDYCHDLNAMHEVERYFDDKTEDEKSLYYDHLSLEMEIFPRNQEEAHWQNDWAILRSTARQRANAFVKAIRKWKGTK